MKEFEQPNAAAPVKTAEQLYEMAFYDPDYDAKNKNINMKQRVVGIMELYANQPKAPVKTVTDEEIKEHANKTYNQWSESDGLSVYDCMVEMGKWMRKQLSGE